MKMEGDVRHPPLDLAVAACDTMLDVAFLRPVALGHTRYARLVPLEFSRYEKLESAARSTVRVKAVGFPRGVWMRSVGELLAGPISGRELNLPMPAVLLTTAFIAHGSSGGVLIDEDNRIIGFTNRIFRPGPTENAVSVCVAGTDVRSALAAFERGESLDHGFIGIAFNNSADLTSEDLYGAGAPPPVTSGVIILRVADSSAAAAADLRPGDIILTMDGKRVKAAREFSGLLGRSLRPGKAVYLRILRDRDVLYKVVLPKRINFGDQ
jgi:serine protease Do